MREYQRPTIGVFVQAAGGIACVGGLLVIAWGLSMLTEGDGPGWGAIVIGAGFLLPGMGMLLAAAALHLLADIRAELYALRSQGAAEAKQGQSKAA